jgi:hypothetical protein
MREFAGKTAFVTGGARGYVFTHPNMREEVDARFAAIQAAMDWVTAR